MNNFGYNKPLFILPFDHRSSFIKTFGQDIENIKNLKQLIYASFRNAVSKTIPKETAAILVDEQFGDAILKDALKQSFTVLLTVEKSGQEEFEFQYGDYFTSHIEKYKPTFAKALVHYDPDDDLEKNKRQRRKLKILSDWCHEHEYRFLLEVIMPKPQNEPSLLLETIEQLQGERIEPDVWKIEGMEKTDDYKRVVMKVQREGRNDVNIVILGRGDNKEMVEKWIRAGAVVDGIIGFAIGRTIFNEPLIAYNNKKINRETAISQISNNFQYFYRIFNQAKNL